MVRVIKAHNEFKLVGEDLKAQRLDPSQHLSVGGLNDLYNAMAPLISKTRKHMMYSIVFNGDFFLGGNQAEYLHEFLVANINLAGFWVKQDGSELLLKNKKGHLLIFYFPNCMKSQFFVPLNAPDCFYLIEPMGPEEENVEETEQPSEQPEETKEAEETKDAEETEEQSEEQLEWQSEMKSPVKGPSSSEEEEPVLEDEDPSEGDQGGNDEDAEELDLTDMPELEQPSSSEEEESVAEKPEAKSVVVAEVILEEEKNAQADEDAVEELEAVEDKSEAVEFEAEESIPEEEKKVPESKKEVRHSKLWKTAGLCPDMLQRFSGPKDASLMADMNRILREQAKANLNPKQQLDATIQRRAALRKELNECFKGTTKKEEENGTAEDDNEVDSEGNANADDTMSTVMRKAFRRGRASRIKARGRAVKREVSLDEERLDSRENSPPPLIESQSY